MMIPSKLVANDAGATAQAAASTIARPSELAEAGCELATLLSHEDANYDELANDDEAEALRRWGDSRRGATQARSFGVSWVIRWIVRSLFGIPAGMDRNP